MSLINPFADYEITGDWAEHIARGSAGGIDYPVGYGTPIPSPAAGTITNRSWWGSAGHIVTLALDEPVGPLRAIQFFHLSAHVPEGHVEQGEVIGYTGASANGKMRGGDVHAHTNGLTATGSRIDWIPYSGGKAQAGSITPKPNNQEEDMSVIVYDKARTDSAAFVLDINDPTRPLSRATGAEFQAATKAGAAVVALEPADFQALLRSRGLFVQDGAQRITPYSAAAVATLSPVQKQYSINHGGFLAVRAAG